MNRQSEFHFAICRPLRQLIGSIAFALAISTSAAIAAEQAALSVPDSRISETSRNIANLEKHGNRFGKALARIEELRQQPHWNWEDDKLGEILIGRR